VIYRPVGKENVGIDANTAAGAYPWKYGGSGGDGREGGGLECQHKEWSEKAGADGRNSVF
jgi:hypothetical protein